jgi:hypothetical protein
MLDVMEIMGHLYRVTPQRILHELDVHAEVEYAEAFHYAEGIRGMDFELKDERRGTLLAHESEYDLFWEGGNSLH